MVNGFHRPDETFDRFLRVPTRLSASAALARWQE
jgi:hypothetical protein